MLIGTTFSHRKLDEFSLAHQPAFEDLLSLHFDIIRLPVYWSEVEQQPRKYNFSTIIQYLEQCQDHNQKVMVTLGMKAPRWPEFYIPSWMTSKNLEDQLFQQALLSYLQKFIETLQHFSCITHWQIENEALDPSGPHHQTIPLHLLQQEIELVRNLDDRPIHTTLWGNELVARNHFTPLLELSDSVGIDLYFKQFLLDTPLGSIYGGPKDSLKKIHDVMQNTGRLWWVTELQAEPWEKDDQTYRLITPRSLSPEQLLKNFSAVQALEPKAILLWGYEYWYWKKTEGDDRYWKIVMQILKR